MPEIEEYINDFYSGPQRPIELGRHDGTSSDSTDPLLQARVWNWLTRHPDVHATSGCGGALARNEELYQSCSCDYGAESSPVDSARYISRRLRQCLRLHTCEEQIWIAATGHGPNHEKLCRSDFACLTIIASRRHNGILQPDLVRISGQDKRSVPTRTQRLSDRGYIVKKPVVAAAARTSHLVLKRFSSSQKGRQVREQGAKGNPPLSSCQGILERSPLAEHENSEGLLGAAIAIINQNSMTMWHDLTARLGISGSLRETNVLLAALGALERKGHVECLKSSDRSSIQERKIARCIRLTSEILDSDLRLLLDAMNGWSFSPTESANEVYDLSILDEVFRLDPRLTFGHQSAQFPQRDEAHNSKRSPSWCLDRPLVNAVHNVVSHAATSGISQAEIKHRTTGDFFVRPLEHTISRLVDHWQFSQPLCLRYMGIIRDATQIGRTAFYVHFTNVAFQHKVEGGSASWEAVGLSEREGQALVSEVSGFSRLPNAGFTLLSSGPRYIKPLQVAQGDHYREAREKRFKVPESSWRHGKTLQQRKKSTRDDSKEKSRSVPFWTYEQQALAIERPSAGSYAGKCVNLRTEGHRGRPRKSRLLIIKSEKLKSPEVIPARLIAQDLRSLTARTQTIQAGGYEESREPSLVLQPTSVEPSSNHESSISTSNRRQSLDQPFVRNRLHVPGLKEAVGALGATSVVTPKNVGRTTPWDQRCVSVSDVREAGVTTEPTHAQSQGSRSFRPPVVGRNHPLPELSPVDANLGREGGRSRKSSKARKSKGSDQTSVESSQTLDRTALEVGPPGTSEAAAGITPAIDRIRTFSPHSHSGGRSHGLRLAYEPPPPGLPTDSLLAKQTHDVQAQPSPENLRDPRPRLLPTTQQQDLYATTDHALHSALPVHMDRPLRVECSNTPRISLPAHEKPAPDVSPQTPGATNGQVETTRRGRLSVQRVGPFGGSVAVARKQTVLNIVEESGGVFPGDRELWYPFTTKWMEQSKAGKPDQRTVKQTKKSLLDSGKLRQVMFTFEDRRGVLSTKSILTLPTISPSDDRVAETRAKMIAAHPDLHIPQISEIRFDIRPSTAALKSDRIRQSMRAGGKPKRPQKRADSPADSEDSEPELVGQGNTEQPYGREASIIGRFGDVRGSEIYFMPSQDPTNDLQKDFGPHMDPRVELGYDSRYLDPELQNLGPRESRNKFAVVEQTTSSPSRNLTRGTRDICAVSGTQKVLRSYREGLKNPKSGRKRESNDSDLCTGGQKAARARLDRISRQAQLASQSCAGHYQHIHSFKADPPSLDARGERQAGELGLNHEIDVQEHSANDYEQAIVPKTQNTAKRDKIEATSTRKKRKRKVATESPRTSHPGVMPEGASVARANDSLAASESQPKRPCVQTRLSELEVGPEFDRALILAVVIVRALTGGLDRRIDWAIVAMTLSLTDDENFVVQRWRLIREKSKKMTENLTREFQVVWLKKYRAGQVVPPDFQGIKQFDWKGVHGWASRELRSNQFKHAVLGSNRRTMEETASIKLSARQDWSDLFDSKTGASILNRRAHLHQRAMASALPVVQQATSKRDQHAALRTCIKSIVAMPERFSDKSKPWTMLKTSKPMDVVAAIQDLLSDKVISPTVEGRSHRAYSISEQFMSRPVSSVQLADLDDGHSQITSLDQPFNEVRAGAIDLTASDGKMLAIINLIASRKASTEQRQLPSIKFGLTQGGYRTRMIDKSLLDFGVGLVPATSPPARRLSITPPEAPSCKGSGRPGASATGPSWIDTDGHTVPTVWRLVVSALLNILVARPGMPQEWVLKCLNAGIEAFEIQAIMKWLVDSQAAVWVGRQSRAIRTKDCWWMVVQGLPMQALFARTLSI